jgi:DNA-binding NtrC family response regulator
MLIEGETGTGKEVAARAIHAASPRAKGPFVTVDASAIPPNLVESELFGSVRGSFTGSTADRRGLFEAANGGTLFLDEIGELPLDQQPKLLRALERREVRPVGHTQARAIDVRVVVATNRDLAVEVNAGRFREDLFFRLSAVRVRLPPLRARLEDLPILVHALLEEIAPDQIHRAPELAKWLARRPFQGNVRELRQVIERSLVLDMRPAVPVDPESAMPGGPAIDPRLFDLPLLDASEALTRAFERAYLARALEENDGNVTDTARACGVSRRHVQKLMIKHALRGAEESDDDE